MKKTVSAALFLISFIALNIAWAPPAEPQPYQGGFTINAEGKITPSTAPVQQAGATYTLTSDVIGNIWIGRNNTVLDGNGHTVTRGITLNRAFNNTVKNFKVTGGQFGIVVWGDSCLIANNTITGTGNGILAMENPTAGIYVVEGGSNIITGNTITNNYNAMSFVETENNLVIGNTIENNKNPEVIVSNVMFWGASNNTVYHNNFIGNSSLAGTAAVDSLYPVNVWDAGYPLGGNYWSNYLTRYPNAVEIDGSGIGNVSYVIDGLNVDRYPLMEPFNTTFEALQTTPPKVSLESPLNQTYYDSSVPLNFSVKVLSPVKDVGWTGYSLDGQRNVTVTSNITLTGLSSGSHSVTVYANDTYGNMGASETVTFTITEQFPVMPVAVGSAAAAVAAAGLLFRYKKRKPEP
ncbi:MAG: right-handed parallel beta-helix repeat-containing protein [Candidatus Bathyarchaeota archaeon]|nr:right-handed parallel beta-helix repeat-containing protein [Candidatus Bathyarchaeota archaeon]